MKTIDKLRVLLGIVKNTFSKKTTENGIEIFYDGDDLVVDAVVYDAEGNAIPDGEYTDGDTIYTIKDSKVASITEKEEVKEVEKEEVVEVENACGDDEEKKIETAEEEVVEEKEEVTEEKVEEPKTDEPTTTELLGRIEALEKAFEEMFLVVKDMKEKETENITKQEEIIREFSQIKRSPTAESITKDNSTKEFNGKMTLSDKLNFLKENK